MYDNDDERVMGMYGIFDTNGEEVHVRFDCLFDGWMDGLIE